MRKKNVDAIQTISITLIGLSIAGAGVYRLAINESGWLMVLVGIIVIAFVTD